MKLDQIRSLDKNDLLGLLGLETRRTMVDYLVPGLVVLTVGVAVGAGLGLLLAPRTGKDMREDLSKRIQHAPEVMGDLPAGRTRPSIGWATSSPSSLRTGAPAPERGVSLSTRSLRPKPSPKPNRTSQSSGVNMTTPNIPSRAEGKIEEVGGAIKKNVGRILNNEEMELEGKLHELKGKANQEVAKETERVKGRAEEASGHVKNHLGHLANNEQLQVEGRLEELKGQARQKLNK